MSLRVAMRGTRFSTTIKIERFSLAGAYLSRAVQGDSGAKRGLPSRTVPVCGPESDAGEVSGRARPLEME